ncbi:MAG: HAD hydrolase-like protein [Cyanobacteria bacterium J06592_8]
MNNIQLAVFDMAGTTVKDNDEVLACFLEAAKATGLEADKETCHLMIQKAMYRLGLTDPQTVVCVGDTPSDLAAGKNANCRLSLGVTNGTHTKAQLDCCENDGLLNCLSDLKLLIKN